MIKSEFNLAAIEKAKVAFGVKTDMALAEILEMQRAHFSHIKNSGSFPSKQMIQACVKHNVSLDWILGIKKSNGAAA